MRLFLGVQILAGVAILLVFGLFAVVGVSRLVGAWGSYRMRIKTMFPHLAVLALVLVLSSVLRSYSAEVSWIVGRNITAAIYNIEGNFVGHVQSFATPELNWYFTFMYVFGYAFLLVFPLIAYALLDDFRPFRITTLSYVFNYLIGLVFYTLFIAFGPRNYLYGDVESLIYTTWTEIEFVTTYVNTNTNVFPSLHTSLAVTVILVAFLTRDEYPRWLYLSVPIAASVLVSTMYLGLHWLIDVVAGVGLAVVSVWLATVLATEKTEDSPITVLGLGFWQFAERSIRRLRN